MELKGVDWERKIQMLIWLPRHLPLIWGEVRRADAVHTPVGGDIGIIGILVALAQRKPLFVRHCGTWGAPASPVDRLLQRFLERIACGRNVVLATGWADDPPSETNPNISWIFSTTLTQAELERIPMERAWSPDVPLRLITVGRLSEPKNVQAVICSLPLIQQKYPGTHFDILGDGEYRPALECLTADWGLINSVTFHGNVSHEDVMKALSQAHLFVFPSRREGFPKAVVEALACGLPVVATRVSVIPHLLENGSGLLLNDTTADAVVQAVLAITSNPDQLAKTSALACEAAQGYTLEAWGAVIGDRLRAAWGFLKAGEK
jgi:glycosyltransferase involved in cell wall biosynthesis